MNTKKQIKQVCKALSNFLIEKNKAYGNSALNPVRIFSKASKIEQLKVRIDDKLSRIQRGKRAGEDPYQDLLGYLILLTVAKKMKQSKSCKPQASTQKNT